jgi:acetate kinase
MDLEFLRTKVALFQGLPDDRLRELVAGSRVEPFAEGETIRHAGDEVHALGVVLDGEVAATVEGDRGELRRVGLLTAGDTFGETALMSGRGELADLVAVTDCRVMLVPLTLFRSHVMAEPRAVENLSRNIAERFHRVVADPLNVAAIARKEDASGLLALKSERPECILVLNRGSASLKWSVFDTSHSEAPTRGLVERIGIAGTRLVQRGPRGEITRELPTAGHAEALAAMLDALVDRFAGAIVALSAISVVGHRVVHGGEKFTGAVLIDDDVLVQLDALAPLAPLHNPLNVECIREARRIWSDVPHVAVFDTGFHASLPRHAFLYGLPYECYARKGIRRFGFHGCSHGHALLATAQFLNRRPRELKMISCHLGNGASLCAIDHGRSVDTTMGFTPLEGLLMGTRCGDLDPGVLLHLECHEGMTTAQIHDVLNHRSGLLGLSGISSDMREIETTANAGDHQALLAFKVFCYRVRKAIGAYIAVLGGIDVLVFTAGIGEGSVGVRAAALQGLECMGIYLDESANRKANGREIARISTASSPVTVLVVPTDEERMIAREVLHALSRDYLLRASEACRTQPIPIEVSAHHVHLSQEHVEALFGAGYQLSPRCLLSQSGQFACREQVSVIGPKGRIGRVRVLGPARKSTQVEVSMTEQFVLGIHPPVRESGDLEGSPGCILEGPAGSVALKQGVICALRHIHMAPADALRYGVRDKSTVRVRVGGDREMVFGDVRVRVDPSFALAMHIDTDEANAAHLSNGAMGFIERVQ